MSRRHVPNYPLSAGASKSYFSPDFASGLAGDAVAEGDALGPGLGTVTGLGVAVAAGIAGPAAGLSLFVSGSELHAATVNDSAATKNTFLIMISSPPF